GPGVSVSGRLLFAGKPLRSAETLPIRIVVTAPDPAQGQYVRFGRSDSGSVDSAGNFHLRGISGRVLFRPYNLPTKLILKAVMLNGNNVTDMPYDTANGDLRGLEVILAEHGQVTG